MSQALDELRIMDDLAQMGHQLRIVYARVRHTRHALRAQRERPEQKKLDTAVVPSRNTRAAKRQRRASYAQIH